MVCCDVYIPRRFQFLSIWMDCWSSRFALPRHISADRTAVEEPRGGLPVSRKKRPDVAFCFRLRWLPFPFVSSRLVLRCASPLSGAAAAFHKFPNPQTLNKSPPVGAIAARNPWLNPVFFRGGPLDGPAAGAFGSVVD